MQFKRTLFITLAFGTLAVLAQPAPGGDPGTGAVNKPDIGAVATDAQKDTCFNQCNDQAIKASFQCYEKCLKKALAGGQDAGAAAEPIQKVGTPVGTLEQRKTCFKKCEPKLINEGENCYVQCLDEVTGGAASAAANAGGNAGASGGAVAGAESPKMAA
ncbi:predicted protein [Lichtheimia corymbifera JMRC:FSU:9682]|uniref:Uncharacterized protein n=1 Tax=Lichtheimia corymbifera JMRC:FSU:9682 TaxID=1263082 RepID=A0A068RYT3_9FUNG|nr:predicted protein [Lichtheimia corymbifera JMRC:FSU:9682]